MSPLSERSFNSDFTVRFRKLSGKGHDEWTEKFAEIEGSFERLMNEGYNLFLGEEQVKTLWDVEEAWRNLGCPPETELYAIPALAGGAN